VRRDIVASLQLREPARYVGSFNRPNLSYRVLPKGQTFRQLLAFVRARSKESGIVYAASRRQVDTLAEDLRAAGIAALPYHAGLGASERSYNQERFVRDDVRVICATVAFGMGIDKPNVRYVVHYDLPKNLESYYQETGRAGRDGLPADCLLYFSVGDTAKQLAFIDEKEGRERELALEGLRAMREYAETTECRRAVLLRHFGETELAEVCTGCDNCLAPRARVDGTLAAQKFLSTVVRVRQAGGFAVGFNHLADILVGRVTDKVRSWNHDVLSTFGIGKDVSRTDWLAVGRELVRLGLLRQTPGQRSVLEHRSPQPNRSAARRPWATRSSSRSYARCASRSPTPATCRPT
jgi:ATP-dependent DNA helicase RecQ